MSLSSVPSGSVCDESKCVSKGNLQPDGTSFTCYGDEHGFFFPMMCADSFRPRRVEDEPPLVVADLWGRGDVTLQYFTCCPPHLPVSNTNTNVTVDDDVLDETNYNAARHCSDPISVETVDGDVDSICENLADNAQKYPRLMKADVDTVYTPFGNLHLAKEDTFVCCDTMLQEDGMEIDIVDKETEIREHYLEEVDCVPYTNDRYQASVAINIVGIIDVVQCDVTEGDFLVARPLGNATYEEFLATRQYQCCKEGPALPPFVHDVAYQKTVYPILTLLSIGALLSLIAVVALWIPLYIQTKRQRERDRKNASKGAASSSASSAHFASSASACRDSSVTSLRGVRNVFRSSNFLYSHQRRSPAVQMASSETTTATPSQHYSSGSKRYTYSTYNLYLIYLAVADFVYFALEIVLFGSTLNQTFYPHFYVGLVVPPSLDTSPLDNKISYAYLAANMWINAIICHQVLVLLQTSRKAKRIHQPSIRRVNLQIGAVYLTSAVYGIALYFLSDAALEAGTHGDARRETIVTTTGFVVMTLMMLPPFLYVIYASVAIWWKGYIPSLQGATTRAKAMRQLAFYFFRIVAIFVVVWLPVFLLLALALELEEYWLLALAYCLTAVQPILTFFLILTKSDTRTYIWDLITLSYLFRKTDSKGRTENVSQLRDNSHGIGSSMGARRFTTSNSGVGSLSGVTTSCLSAGNGVSCVDATAKMDDNEDDNGSDNDSADALFVSVLGFSDSFQPKTDADADASADTSDGTNEANVDDDDDDDDEEDGIADASITHR